MISQADSGLTIEEPRTGLAQFRRLPVVSWVWPARTSAEAGAGCGLVGGACCVGGAAVKGLGLASATAVSNFVGVATPYFIAASVIGMLAWAAWLFRGTGYQAGPFARILARQGAVMGVIYGATLGATMLVASTTGLSM